MGHLRDIWNHYLTFFRRRGFWAKQFTLAMTLPVLIFIIGSFKLFGAFNPETVQSDMACDRASIATWAFSNLGPACFLIGLLIFSLFVLVKPARTYSQGVFVIALGLFSVLTYFIAVPLFETFFNSIEYPDCLSSISE